MFNPVFPATMMAIMKMTANMMMGIEHVPKKGQLNQTGKLFKRSDMVEEMEDERDART